MPGRGAAATRVCGVVLAAGPSLRFGGGRPKQVAELEGEPLVRRIARRALASRLGAVAVVVGHAADEVRAALAGLAVEVVQNPRYAEGQSTSVRAGLAAVEGRSEAVLFLPADQPFVTTGLIDRIVAVYRDTGSLIVAPAYRGRRGSPVLFARQLFGELGEIGGDAGGRQLFARHPEALVEVELESDLPLLDVDTAEDLRRLEAGQ